MAASCFLVRSHWQGRREKWKWQKRLCFTVLPRAALTQLYLMCYTFVISIATPSKYKIENYTSCRAPKRERQTYGNDRRHDIPPGGWKPQRQKNKSTEMISSICNFLSPFQTLNFILGKIMTLMLTTQLGFRSSSAGCRFWSER